MSRESNKGINFHKIKNKAFLGDPSKVHREIKKIVIYFTPLASGAPSH
jgi:hypothetical protein